MCENASPDFRTALQHHPNIQTVHLDCCSDDEFVLPVLQMLASPETTSRVSTLMFYRPNNSSMPSERVTEAMRQCFQCNGGASFQTVVFDRHCFKDRPASSAVILDSLTRSTSVKEVGFSWCTVSDEESAQQDSLVAHQVANLVRNKLNLESLRLEMTDFFQYDQFTTALVEVLARPESKLCFLELESGGVPLPAFRALMTALSRASPLRHLVIKIDADASGDDYIQALTSGIPLLKIKEITIDSSQLSSPTPTQKASLLEALKNNYVLQSVQCFGLQTQLEFCLNRNRKLAEWTENPNLVPRELWYMQ